jgi:hypothetical protein
MKLDKMRVFLIIYSKSISISLNEFEFYAD